jgi:hypothetical protein
MKPEVMKFDDCRDSTADSVGIGIMLLDSLLTAGGRICVDCVPGFTILERASLRDFFCSVEQSRL